VRVAPAPLTGIKERGVDAIEECARNGYFMVVLASFNHSEELVQAAHSLGMEARSSGIRTKEQMIEAVQIGCNGMTVNWPDWLMDYWNGVLTQQVVDNRGFSGYSFVIYAPDEVGQPIAGLREQLDIPVPMIPAHVTVKGTFVLPSSLEDVEAIAEKVARSTSPFPMKLGEPLVWGKEESRALVISVESSPHLDALHGELFRAIEPITTNVYGNEREEAFHFHMTVYQEVDDANHRKGQALAASLQLPEEVEARSMCLMGRVGPRSKAGEWRIIREFPFE
jgi:2'-5' RNA ligase